ncbi:MAG: peptide deformylase [Clostridia bacterium]|jgi:peptide deformylase
MIQIKTYPNKILLHKSEEVKDVFDKKTNALLSSLGFILFKNINALGIASPQIGILKRVFVIRLDRLTPEGLTLQVINPKVIGIGEKVIEEESCLSLPNKIVKVERFKEVTLFYKDSEGKDQELVAGGQLARCIQHEYDHLEGKLIWWGEENAQ